MAKDQLTQVADINAILNKTGQKLGISATQTTEASGAVKFSVSFDSGSFFSNGFLNENLGYIQKALKPLDPVAELLTTEIPLISDYKDIFYAPPINFNQDSNPGSISLLDVIGFAAETTSNKIDVKLIDEVFSFGKFVNKIPRSGEKINLGELTINPTGEVIQNPFANISLPALDLPSSFNIPILKNPVDTAFGILLNQNKTLFSYDAPKFKLALDNPLSIEIPIVGIVGGVLTGKFGAEIQLGFGFDTYGLQSGRSFEDGFFVADYAGDEVSLSGGLGIGVFAGIPSVANLRATLDPGLTLGFNINDPSPESPGVVRFSEIEDFNSIFKTPQLDLNIGVSANIVILGSSIAGVSSPKLDFVLGEFPPEKIKAAADKVIGYIEQIKDLKDGKLIGRLGGKLKNYVEEKVDQFRREITPDNVIEDLFGPGGVLLSTTEYKGLDGLNVIKKFPGGNVFEWGGGVLKSTSIGGKTTLFDSLGEIVGGSGTKEDFLSTVINVGSGGLFGLVGEDDSDPLALPLRPSSDEIIYRPNGSIWIQTGIGADVLDGSDEGDEIRAGGGNDYVAGEGGRDFLYGESGNDLLNGGADNDVLDGGTGNDTLKGGTGNDTLNGGADDDTLLGEAGIDTLNGGTGNDTLKGGGDGDFLYGGADIDTLDGEIGNDQLFGQDGNDQLLSSDGNDLLDGGADLDTARYDKDPTGVIVNIDETQGYSNVTYSFDLEPSFTVAASTAFDGFGDTDTLRNLENITGSTYDDVLIGNALSNTLNGLGGNDLLIGNGGDDLLDGGDGIDTLSYRRSSNSSNIGVSVDLSNNIAFDGIDGLDTLRNIENVIGSRYADRLTGDDKANTILGGHGDDIINGNGGDDTLFGEDGNDKIFGDSGDDTLIGGTGSGWPSDILDGGTGNDTASYITATSAVSASLAQGTGWQGDATGDKFISIENLTGSNYDDFLIGDDNANVLTGGEGNDTLQGQGGNDTLFGGNGNDTLEGGEGNDTLDGGSDNNILNAGEGNNTIFALNGDDTVYAGSGNDFINVGDGRNQVYAGEGNNTIVTGKDDDKIYGGSGNDTIFAGEGTNEVYAGEGRNIVTTGNGNDKIYGGSNIDVIRAGDGTNEVYASEGINLIVTGSGTDKLYGGSSLDVIIAGEGKNDIYASEGNNIISTGNGPHLVYTGSGNDAIRTGSGNDTIYASEGNNYIDSGSGFDTLYSGSGSDFFVLYGGTGFDTIINFNRDRDTIGLTGGLTDSDLIVSQVSSGGYYTEITVGLTGDLLAQVQGIHLTANQISWTELANPASAFETKALDIFNTTINNNPAVLNAGITEQVVRGLV